LVNIRDYSESIPKPIIPVGVRPSFSLHLAEMEPNGRVSAYQDADLRINAVFSVPDFRFPAHGEELVKESFRWPIEASASRLQGEGSGAPCTP